MLNLQDILEGVRPELVQKLKDLIESPEFNDQMAKKMLNSVYSNSPEQKAKIQELFIQKGIEDCIKFIFRILKEYDEVDLLRMIVDNEITLPDSSKFISHNNIYQLIQEYYNIDIECLRELAELHPSKNSITRGMFEVIVQLFLNDIADKNSSKGLSGHGDVNTKLYSMEFKTPGARVKSQKEHSAKGIEDYISDFLEKRNLKIKLDPKGTFHSQASISKFFNELKQLSLTDDELYNLIEGALFNQYDIDENEIKKLGLDTSIKNSIVSGGKVDAKYLIRLMGCIQLRYYQLEEKYSHFIIFKGKNGAESIKRGDYACLPGDYVNNINKVFADKSIEFQGGGNPKGTVRDHYCQIFYK